MHGGWKKKQPTLIFMTRSVIGILVQWTSVALSPLWQTGSVDDGSSHWPESRTQGTMNVHEHLVEIK